MPRLFIALRVPLNETFERVLGQFRGLRGVSVVRPENLHYTLRFLGDVTAETKELLLGILGRAHIDERPFPLQIQGTGAFPNPGKPRVIWAGCAQRGVAPMMRLAEHVDSFTNDVGLGDRDKPFVPHLTLARVKARGGRGMEAASAIIKAEHDTDYGHMRAERVHLVESALTPQGPVYEDLLEVPLQ